MISKCTNASTLTSKKSRRKRNCRRTFDARLQLSVGALQSSNVGAQRCLEACGILLLSGALGGKARSLAAELLLQRAALGVHLCCGGERADVRRTCKERSNTISSAEKQNREMRESCIE